MSTKLVLGLAAGALVLGFQPAKTALNAYTQYPDASGWILVGTFCLIVVAATHEALVTAIRFAWAVGRPLPKSNSQQGRLDAFYQTQADIYDKTRSKLLRGRTTMLKLSAAHLKEQRKADPSKRLIWLDIGGGTGKLQR